MPTLVSSSKKNINANLGENHQIYTPYLSDCKPRLTLFFALFLCGLQFFHCSVLVKLRITQNVTTSGANILNTRYELRTAAYSYSYCIDLSRASQCTDALVHCRYLFSVIALLLCNSIVKPRGIVV